VKPARDRANLNLFDVKTVNLTWNITSYEKDIMRIKLVFNNFAEISPLVEQDELIFHIKDPLHFFISDEYLTDLDIAYWTLSSKLKKQMDDTPGARSVMSVTQYVSESILNALVATFLVNIVFQGAMSYLVSFINSLQMIIHLPLLQIIVPGNVNNFFKILMPIVNFEILDSSWTTELLFKFDFEDLEENSKDILDQTRDLGYDSHNTVLNMGSLGIYSFLYFAKVLFVLIPIKLFLMLTGIGNKIFEKLCAYLFFSELLEIIMDGYFEIIIASILGHRDTSESTTSGQEASNYLGIYLMVVCCAIPVVCLWVAMESNEYLRSPAFQKRWGLLVNDVRFHKNLGNKFYSFIFIMRRMFLVAVAFLLTDYPTFQF
jgi:hypothetical protein